MVSNLRILFLACGLFLVENVYGGSYWLAPANNLVPRGSSGTVDALQASVYDPTSGQLIQVWIATTSGIANLYYSAYNGTTWNTPVNNRIPLGLSSGFYGGYEPSVDPGSGQVLQIWEGPDLRFYYAVYNGTEWSTPSNNQIPLGSSSGIKTGFFDTAIYDSTSHQLFSFGETVITAISIMRPTMGSLGLLLPIMKFP